MITAFFYNFAFAILSAIINIFPTGTGFPTEVHTAVAGIGKYIQLIDTLVPISTLATVIGLVFTVEIAFFGFKTLKWLLSFIPIIGGKGI